MSSTATLEQSLRSALPRWGWPEDATLRLLSISENAVFLLEPPGQKFVLRVQRPGYNSSAEIVSELNWVEALCEARVVPIPRPVRDSSGALLVHFMEDGAPRMAVAFEFMNGRPLTPTDDLVTWFRELGGMAARMHVHARNWTRPEGFTRRAWTLDDMIGRGAVWGHWRNSPGLDPEGAEILAELERLLRAQVEDYGSGPERYGLIHGDMRFANLLLHGDRLGLIDFDDCGPCWYVFDFAASIAHYEDQPFVPAVKTAWLEGYRRFAPFGAEDEAALDMFMQVRRLQMTAWMASHADTSHARQAGAAYTRTTVRLAADYLERTQEHVHQC